MATRQSRQTRRPPRKKTAPNKAKATAPSPAPNQQYSPALIVSALERSRGMVSIAARLLQCNRQTIYNAAKIHPEIKDAMDGERELMLDTAELKLIESVNKGQAWAVCFFLKTQGRKRGYIEKQDIGLEASTLEELVLLAQKRRAEGKTEKPEHA